MAEKKHEDGMDILKFFIGVMSLLTIFVAGFAGYNWSAAEALDTQVTRDEESLRDIMKLAGKPEFKTAVARSGLAKEVDPRKTQLGLFLTDSAKKLGFELASNNSEGGGSSGGAPPGFLRLSNKITIQKQSLEVIADYLFYVQASWPGLKIEQIDVNEMPGSKEGAFLGWNASVQVSIFRPKD